ncbi:MAG: HEPN domain-containing protein, partial [Bacteroidota bacterium]|nr:HEPN domain-containing protein [Bacteroidota bacterium]
FAYKVVTLGAILYSSDETRLVAEALPVDELIKAQNQSTYNEGRNKVNEFLSGADLYKLRKQNKMAAFMLHQAAEHALHTILKIGTGLYINTHNLDKLMRYCSMASWHLPEIFARTNEKNERLFQLLQKAYISGRYKDNYSISTPELMTIADRVKQLQNVMKVYKS